jgi:glycosyltransferase involved in cell wall biosynthesis
MISFVVPAYDEELLLGATLAAIRRAADACGEAHEVVVADDASSDRTAEVAERHGARVVRVAHRQIAATRNSGARAARGELLVFVDADTLIDAYVLRAALAALRSGAVGGGCAVRFDGSVPAYARIVTPLLVASFRTLGFACGCFVFCTRAAFEATGGFDEKLFGAEELAFSRALARLGRFVVLRESVATSGRKMRTHTGWEILGALGKLAIRGPRSVRRREGMEFWYGKRRVELAE